MARQFLRNPYFVYDAARALKVDIAYTPQHFRGKL